MEEDIILQVSGAIAAAVGTQGGSLSTGNDGRREGGEHKLAGMNERWRSEGVRTRKREGDWRGELAWGREDWMAGGGRMRKDDEGMAGAQDLLRTSARDFPGSFGRSSNPSKGDGGGGMPLLS
eukprot:756928-Hanusia_phi.AAC.3